MLETKTEIDWTGCYSGNYDLWCPDAYCHPAKMAPGLCYRILEHLEAEGLLTPGATILDPMGGISTSLLASATNGYPSIGIELEDKFVALSMRNFEKLTERYCTCNERGREGYLRWLREGIHLFGHTEAKEEESSRQEGVLQSPLSNGAEQPSLEGWLDSVGLQVSKNRRRKGNPGTPVSDGEPSREDTRTERAGTPPERGQTGQSDRESDARSEFRSLTLAQFRRQHLKTTMPKMCPSCGKAVTPFPVILQGDSRKLSSILAEKCVTVTSPPYADAINSDTKGGIDWMKCAEGPRPDKLRPTASHGTFSLQYGHSDGQIGQLPDKPLTIVSPPYSEADQHKKDDHGLLKNNKWGLQDRVYTQSTQGTDPNNVANLPDKPLTVMSPPYEKGVAMQDLSFMSKQADDYPERLQAGLCKGHNRTPEAEKRYLDKVAKGTIEDPESIGNQEGETYLSAMRQVYSEIAKVSDVLVVVTKNPTRNGKLRRLDEDTISLLEATGWTIKCTHKAILFEEQETQDLFGNGHKKVKGRLSFFKRLSYQKGSPVAQWEDVICAVKGNRGGIVTVSSPPYEDITLRAVSGSVGERWRNEGKGAHENPTNYGQTPGQIGNLKDRP